LKVLQCSLDLENYCSNFKIFLENLRVWRSCWSVNNNIWWSKNGFKVAVGDALILVIEKSHDFHHKVLIINSVTVRRMKFKYPCRHILLYGMTITNLLPHFIYKPTKFGTRQIKIINKGE